MATWAFGTRSSQPGYRRVLPLLLILAAALAAVSMVRRAKADEDPSLEYRVKAAFLYNFAKFAAWPSDMFPEDNTPITIGVLGRDPFHGSLDATIAGKTIDDRKIVVRRAAAVESLRNCHILFISRSERPRLASIMQKLSGSTILTVSDIDDFAHRGGVIGFFMEDDRVRFEINTSAAQRANLLLSSKLLRLGRIISD